MTERSGHPVRRAGRKMGFGSPIYPLFLIFLSPIFLSVPAFQETDVLLQGLEFSRLSEFPRPAGPVGALPFP